MDSIDSTEPPQTAAAAPRSNNVAYISERTPMKSLINNLDRRRAASRHQEGRSSAPKPRIQLKEIRAQHLLILKCHLRGMTAVEIAQIVGMTPQNVTYVQNSDIYISLYREKQRERMEQDDEESIDVSSTLSRLAKTSVSTLENILRHQAEPDDTRAQTLKAEVAFDILDRAGYKPTQRLEHEHTIVSYADKLKEAHAKRQAAAACSRPPIDTSLVEAPQIADSHDESGAEPSPSAPED